MHKNQLWLVVMAVAATGTGCLSAEPGTTDESAPANEAPATPAPAATNGIAVNKPAIGQPPAPNEAMRAAQSGILPAKPGRGAAEFVASGITAHPDVTPTLTGGSASPASPWPTQTVTLTATSSSDVGPTPYYLRIWDSSAGAYIAVCGSGTTCSATVTKSTVTEVFYEATLADINGNQPDPDHDWLWIIVDWHSAGLSLHESANQVAVGGSVTITATSQQDIGPSPFFTTIYDVTTGALVGECGSGTSCSASVSQSAATTHQYVACFGSISSTFPPTNKLECTQLDPVTWTSSGVQVKLNGPASVNVDGTGTVTATATIDVGPTPYWIEIFDLDTSTLLQTCGSGTTCTTQLSPQLGDNHLVAFIASSSSTLLPPNIQAESNVIDVTGIEVIQ